jgi:glutaconate CoA-transferase subunit B
VHEGVTAEAAKAATGWALRVARDLRTLPAPTGDELAILRDLQARTRAAHGAGRGRAGADEQGEASLDR